MIFFNKEKLNFEEDEIPLDFSQMVYHSRRPHQGFEEVITWKFHCNKKGDCKSGVCDMCNQCKSYTVSYVYVGSQPVNQEITPSEPISGGGSGGYNGGTFIPNPYDGLNDLSNPMMILAGQINEFLNTLATPLKNAATSNGIYELTHAYFLQMGLNGHSQQHYTASLSNYLSIISGLNMNHLSFDAQQKFRFWCFKTLLHNNFENSNFEKINTVKNLINNLTFNSETKNYIINSLYSQNNQEFLNKISFSYNLYLSNTIVFNSNRITNWYLTPSEGNDFFYNSSNNYNPDDINPQELPTWSDFNNLYPTEIGADNVYSLVGGQVWQARLSYPERTQNTCALKVSIALNRCGINIPNLQGQTLQGSDGNFYFLNARRLNEWLRLTFGTNTGSTPNLNHISFTDGASFTNHIVATPIKGIYSLITPQNPGVSGHADILFENGTCLSGCQLDIPIERIDLWILN